MSPIPLKAPDLPVLFLSAISRVVNQPEHRMSYSQRVAIVEQMLRRAHSPLPAAVIVPLADELTALADEYPTMKVLLEHFDTVEHTVRLTALGVETAMAGWTSGDEIFLRPPARTARVFNRV